MAKPVDRREHWARIHRPCRGGQLVLVVAAMAEPGEELLQGSVERSPVDAIAYRVQTVVEDGCQLDVVGNDAPQRPLLLGDLSRVDVVDATHQPIGEPGWKTRPVDQLVEHGSRAGSDHAEVQQSLHALGEAVGVLGHVGEQLVVGGDGRVGHCVHPRLRVRPGQVQRRQVRIAKDLHQEPCDAGGSQQVAVTLRLSIGRYSLDLAEDLLVAGRGVHSGGTDAHDPSK